MAAALELTPLAQRAVARQRMQLRDRKVALLQHLDHGLADQAGGADDRDGEFCSCSRVIRYGRCVMSGVD